MGKVAFVAGANGITGPYILEHLCKNSDASDWSEFIATSFSLLNILVKDDRIKFILLDFTKPASELIDAMRPVCGRVTHAFFSSYLHNDDFAELNVANARLFQNFIDALLAVAPNLEACVLQTGGKHYNVHLGPVPSPAREEDPRIETSMGNFYFAQEDYLMAKHKESGGYDDVSDARLVADISVWAATTPSAGNEAFNVANGDTICWQHLWPRLAAYVGAKASSNQAFTKPRPSVGQTQLEKSLYE
ncbi:hypothetical protein VHEMI01013 [[Torrubiella] hemipterigena]|uniref:PRISE-like Rossmann-fold domain-containing protein n=1 Tax=[Torrubiella] hemipterigena TaxID=1531966 RepID=A0A0A1SKS4_9HYPO|nr:hypothetical protein VHEMI01013 [[Torrubiella] hemipterigena]